MKYKNSLLLSFLSFLLLLTGGCGGKMGAKVYRIGVDPSFFPLDLQGQTMHVFAFTNELLHEIGRVKKAHIVRLSASWDNLLEGLKLQKYEAALSSMNVTLVSESKFSFSKPYLKTGPVLVVQKENEGVSLETLSHKVVAIEKTDTELELMSNYPNIDIIFYDRLVDSLESVSKGAYEGALAPVLLAEPYVRDIFHTLTVASDVLTDEGVRLVTCKDACPEIIAIFNEGLQEVIKNGTYKALLEKWQLSQP